jgi:bacteriocin biosynthesis cyclodehydratase domain-containing protein
MADRDPEQSRPSPKNLPAGLTRDAVLAVSATLNGKNSVSQIWGKLLSEGLSPDAISAGLEYLDSLNLIEEGDVGIRTLSAAELQTFSAQMRVLGKSFPSQFDDDAISEEVDGMRLQAALKNSRLVITDCGDVATALALHLAQAGFGHVILPTSQADGLSHENKPYSCGPNAENLTDALGNSATEKPALVIHCPDQFAAERCEEVNRACLRARTPMLPYRRVGLDVEIGPLIVPYETACYTCYVKRREAVLSPWEKQHAVENNDLGVFRVPLGIDFLVIEALKVVIGRSEPVTRSRLLRLSFLGGIPELHPVLKLPRCPTCGVNRVKPSRKLWEE